MLIVPIVAVGLAALGLAGYFLLRGGRRDDPAVCHAHCPRCDQRVRYGAARAGSAVMCPRCRRRWTLPTTPQAQPASAAFRQGRDLIGRRSA